jgi:hypothetical protein
VSAPVFDLAAVTETTDIVIDGHVLWVRPGRTESGRYWQLLTGADLRVGMVVERDGALEAAFELAGPVDVVRRIVAGLCGGAA